MVGEVFDEHADLMRISPPPERPSAESVATSVGGGDVGGDGKVEVIIGGGGVGCGVVAGRVLASTMRGDVSGSDGIGWWAVAAVLAAVVGERKGAEDAESDLCVWRDGQGVEPDVGRRQRRRGCHARWDCA